MLNRNRSVELVRTTVTFKFLNESLNVHAVVYSLYQYYVGHYPLSDAYLIYTDFRDSLVLGWVSEPQALQYYSGCQCELSRDPQQTQENT